MRLIHIFQTAESSFTYIGDFLGGKRNGQGTSVSADGKYKGFWCQDLRHGQGVLVQNVIILRRFLAFKR
jgi:hypothetical protein